MEAERPLFVLIAGVNGAGKSTFYHAGMWNGGDRGDIEWINPDDILRELGGDQGSQVDQLNAGKVALRRMRDALRDRVSFCEETTLAGVSCLRRIEEAKRNGFYVAMYYIGVSHPQIAQRRISHRVSVGGHAIPDEVVARRYVSSLENLNRAIELCDEVHAFDNTTRLTQWATWKQGFLVSWDVFPVKENWLFNCISEELVEI